MDSNILDLHSKLINKEITSDELVKETLEKSNKSSFIEFEKIFILHFNFKLLIWGTNVSLIKR